MAQCTSEGDGTVEMVATPAVTSAQVRPGAETQNRVDGIVVELIDLTADAACTSPRLHWDIGSGASATPRRFPGVRPPAVSLRASASGCVTQAGEESRRPGLIGQHRQSAASAA